MGLYDRDYYRSSPRRPGGIGALRMWSLTTWLIVINVAVFVADALLRQRIAAHFHVPPDRIMGPLEFWGFFSISTAFQRLQLWRLLTCQFLHAGIWHIGVNMFGLWIFGPLVESALGSRRYAFLYLLCGIAGPVMFTLLWALHILYKNSFLPGMNTPLVGASASIFGIIIAAAYLSPNRVIYIFVIEMPLKVFAWLMVGLAAWTVFMNGPNAGGQAAHLGGALLGWALIRHQSTLDLVSRPRFSRRRHAPKDWSRDLNR